MKTCHPVIFPPWDSEQAGRATATGLRKTTKAAREVKQQRTDADSNR